MTKDPLVLIGVPSCAIGRVTTRLVKKHADVIGDPVVDRDRRGIASDDSGFCFEWKTYAGAWRSDIDQMEIEFSFVQMEKLSEGDSNNE